MKSKIVFLCALLFCGMMTTWLVRYVYFPELVQRQEVEFSLLLRKFLLGAADVTTFQVYQEDQKLGFASINSRPVNRDSKDQHFVLMTGFLQEGAIPNMDDQLAIRMEFRVEDFENLHGLKGQLRMPKLGHVLDFHWPKDAKMPSFVYKQGGKVIATEQTIAPLLRMSGSPDLLKQSGLNEDSLSLEQSTTAGSLEIAGQPRAGYFWELKVAKRWKIRAFFTEVGQLALVDFPGGYRLLEPIMYGLVPDYTDENVVGEEDFQPAAEPEVKP